MAIQSVAQKLSVVFIGYTFRIEWSEVPRIRCAVELGVAPTPALIQKIEECIDLELKSLNIEYESKRKLEDIVRI